MATPSSKTKVSSQRHIIFYPKILSAIKDYTLQRFIKDLIAGIMVGIIAFPLSIAFGIASGVTPQQGLVTAVIAGFLISALGGSRVQIGGPTGAFIVVVYGIVSQYGISGLTIATLLAGIMLILMGIFKLGNWIRFVPNPVVIGFTSGIALVIFSSQMRDLLGLAIPSMPPHFVEQWAIIFHSLSTLNPYAVFLGALTIGITLFLNRFFPKIPGIFVALLLTSFFAALFHFPIETIGSRFGAIDASFPIPHIPTVTFSAFRWLVIPALTIALLGAIESLLSAVVADGMIGGKHRPNTELIAQGICLLYTSPSPRD